MKNEHKLFDIWQHKKGSHYIFYLRLPNGDLDFTKRQEAEAFLKMYRSLRREGKLRTGRGI